MKTKKITIVNKLSILSTLLIALTGIIISVYIPNNIYAKTATLAHTPVSLSMTLLKLLYNFIVALVLIFVIINCCIHVKKKAFNKVLSIHILTVLVALFSLLYLPLITKPWNDYQFSGFIDGIKKNIDEDVLKTWVEQTVSDLELSNGKVFERGELNYLSRNRIFECEAVVQIKDENTYSVTMFWGGGAVTDYGIYSGTDKEKFGYIKSHYDVVEVFDDIYAWTSK